jgi:hypothetical protein
MPKDWRSFYPDLRSSEWAIHALCQEGARQLILTGDLDLAAIAFDPEPPTSFQPPLPRSARAMHQRIQDTARFHADPERYIRRHAARIRAATTGPAATAGAPRPSVVVSSSFFIFPASAGQRIRAPPWLARRPETHPRPPAATPARSRRYAPSFSASSTKLPA